MTQRTTNTVFTGAAVLSDGRKLLRDQLIAAAVDCGMHVFPSYNRNCHFLVASRHDTVKARKAVEDGKLVLTYDEFVCHLAAIGVDAFDEKYAKGVKENPIVDKPVGGTAWQEKNDAGAFVL